MLITKSRFKEGFRRLGLILGLLFGVVGGMVGFAVFSSQTETHWHLAGMAIGIGLLLFLIGLVLGRMIGWAVAGFFASS